MPDHCLQHLENKQLIHKYRGGGGGSNDRRRLILQPQPRPNPEYTGAKQPQLSPFMEPLKCHKMPKLTKMCQNMPPLKSPNHQHANDLHPFRPQNNKKVTPKSHFYKSAPCSLPHCPLPTTPRSLLPAGAPADRSSSVGWLLTTPCSLTRSDPPPPPKPTPTGN